MRLNFEFNVEVYDADLGSDLVQHFDDVRGTSQKMTLGAFESRSFPTELRDLFAKIFAPYL